MERTIENSHQVLHYGAYEYRPNTLEYRVRNCILQFLGVQSVLQEQEDYKAELQHDLYRVRQTLHGHEELKELIATSNQVIVEKQNQLRAILNEIITIRSALGYDRFYSFIGQISNFEPELRMGCTDVLTNLHHLDQSLEELTTEQKDESEITD